MVLLFSWVISLSLLWWWKHRNTDQAPISCEESSCKFPAVPQLEEYNISLVVRDQLGEETANYSFNFFDRGQRSRKHLNSIWNMQLLLYTLSSVFKALKTQKPHSCNDSLYTQCGEISAGVHIVLLILNALPLEDLILASVWISCVYCHQFFL